MDALERWRTEFKQQLEWSNPDSVTWSDRWLAGDRMFLQHAATPIRVRRSTPLKVWRAHRAGLVYRHHRYVDYPDNWDFKRFRLKHRADYACTICHRAESADVVLHAHHIVHRCHSGTNNDRNLVILCVKHHQEQHPGHVIGSPSNEPLESTPASAPVVAARATPTAPQAPSLTVLNRQHAGASPPVAQPPPFAQPNSKPRHLIHTATPVARPKSAHIPIMAVMALMVAVVVLAFGNDRPGEPDPMPVSDPMAVDAGHGRVMTWQTAADQWEAAHAEFLSNPERAAAMQAAIYAVDAETGRQLTADELLARAYALASSETGWEGTSRPRRE